MRYFNKQLEYVVANHSVSKNCLTFGPNSLNKGRKIHQSFEAMLPGYPITSRDEWKYVYVAGIGIAS